MLFNFTVVVVVVVVVVLIVMVDLVVSVKAPIWLALFTSSRWREGRQWRAMRN